MNKNPEVFISYHTRSSAEAVRQISAALEGVGISCWYAPRNVEGDYASSIVRGINGCRVFLVILNEYADQSEDVRNEINIAFERVRRHEDITILPFRTDDKALSDAVLYYLGRMHMMDGGIPPEMLRIRELLDRISYLLGREAVRTHTEANPETGAPKQYRLVAAPVYPDNDFVGRERELAEIRRQLSGRKNKLFLVGMGGIGKSQVAMAYCDRFREDHDLVLWVTFDTSLRKTVINDFAFPIDGLDRADYPNEDDAAYFRRKLGILKRVADRNVLIVVDNFDVAEDPDLEEFCAGTYGVLFTTRTHGLSGRLPELEIEAMTAEEDMWALFRAEYRRAIRDEAGVRMLLERLNGHPLTIRLAASALQSNRRLTPEMLLEIFDGSGNKSAAEAVYGRLRRVFSLAALTEEDLHLLKNLALMPLRGVEVESFYDWCGLDDFDVIDELIRKSWVIHNPATDEVHLHPLLADLLAEELEKDPGCCDALLDTLTEKNRKIIYLNCRDRDLLHACSESALRRLPGSHPKAWNMRWTQATTVFETSQYLPAIDMMRPLLDSAPDLGMLLTVYGKIAHGYCLAGHPAESIRWSREGLSKVAHLPEESLSRLAGARKNDFRIRMAEAYRHMHEFDKAVEIMGTVEDNYDRFYGTSPEISRGWAWVHMAVSYFKRNAAGDNEKALEWYDKALAQFRKAGDRLSPAYILENVGQIHMRRGEFDKAFAATRQTQELLLEFLGARHIDIGILAALEGNIHRAMGDEEAALRCYAKAREIIREQNHTEYERRLDEIVAGGKVGYLT